MTTETQKNVICCFGEVLVDVTNWAQRLAGDKKKKSETFKTEKVFKLE